MSLPSSQHTSTLAPPPSSRPSILRAISSSSSIPKSSLSPISRKDKPRLYLGLYLRGGSNTSSSTNTVFNSSLTCPAYHWAFLIGPKTASRHDPGTCFQILHSTDRSYYEETDLSTLTPSQSATLLVRITLAKVLNEEKVRSIIRSISHSTSSHHKHQDLSPVPSHSRDEVTEPNAQLNDCLAWTRKIYLTLFSPHHATNTTPSSKALKTYMTIADWAELEQTARKYAKKKRNLGRFHSLGIGLNRGPGAGEGHDDGNGLDHPDQIQRPNWFEWEDDEIATWNFWERRETTN